MTKILEIINAKKIVNKINQKNNQQKKENKKLNHKKIKIIKL